MYRQPPLSRVFFTFLASAILASVSGFAAETVPGSTEHILVVFKTHFDIGYNAAVAEILAKYRSPMVDNNAMKVIANNRTSPAAQRFSWTIPGWPLTRIIDREQTPDRRAKVIEALKEGSLAVHALPFSLHNESLEIEDLFAGFISRHRLPATWAGKGAVGNHYGDEWKDLLAKGPYSKWLRTFEDKCDHIRKTDDLVSKGLSEDLDALASAAKTEAHGFVVYNPLP
jgi:hypothetical protein